MPNLKDIRKRIGSVKNTQKITRAMKLVAASKLRRAQNAIEAARPYSMKIHEVVSVLASAVEPDAHPLLQSKDECDKALILVITSDKGLCGPFNGALLRRVERFLVEHKDDANSFELMVIGRKGGAFYKAKGREVAELHEEVLDKGASAEAARTFTNLLSEKFNSGEYDKIYLAYNEFQSAIAQEQRVEQILPVVPATLENKEDESSSKEFLFEPDKEKLLDVLLPKYVQTAVFRAMLDSVASEHGSRMTAMDSATNNASDLIESLTLQYNRARQAAITRELVEITTGAQAISG